MATPDKTKEYSVVVTDQNLRKIGTDVVKVTAVFREMHFSPDHLVQGDPESEVTASILDPGDANLPSEISWTLVPPFLGCTLEQEGVNARISAGPQFGKVKVKALNLNDPGCFIEKELPVNKGVKDVLAIDLTAPSERRAKTGETLYVLNDPNVKIEAIPNEGGYPEDLPDWQQDSYGSTPPPDFDWSEIMTEILPNSSSDSKTSEYIAGELPEGEPKVTVIRKKQAVTSDNPIPIPGMSTIDDKIAEYFRFVNQPEAPCGAPIPFSISLSLPEIKLKASEVEKYNHPGLGFKEEVTLAAGLAATGKIFHPGLTKTIDVQAFNQQVIFCSRLYGELMGTVDISLPFLRSDSLEDFTWRIVDPSLTLGFSMGAGLEFALVPPGFMVLAGGKAKSKLDLIFNYSISEEKVTYKIKVDPLTLTLSMIIKVESDPGKYEDLLPKALSQYLSRTWELFKGKEYGPFDLYSF
jgi:hypothetical protein